MPKQFKEPQAFEEGPAPDIALNPVESHKISAIGYDPETRTLAVTFQRSTSVYHYGGGDTDSEGGETDAGQDDAAAFEAGLSAEIEANGLKPKRRAPAANDGKKRRAA